jgi:hypothetical protein
LDDYFFIVDEYDQLLFSMKKYENNFDRVKMLRSLHMMIGISGSKLNATEA